MKLPAPILLIDDDENDVLLTELAIRKAGIPNPFKALFNGGEAIRYLSGDGIYADRTLYPIPALILLDLKMPLLTGFDVLRWVRCHPSLPQVAIIVLTASSASADIEKAKSLGAADYRVKPSDFACLVPTLRELQARWLTPEQGPGTGATVSHQSPVTGL